MNKRMLPRESIHSGSLILVNAQHAYRPAASEDVVRLPGPSAVYLDRRAAVLLGELMVHVSAVAGTGEEIVYVSGWRSQKEQQQIWDSSLKENGEEFTRKFVAMPGHSEHQTGLAIDLALKQEKIDFICPEFPYEGICQRFRELAPRYGFIERYREDKQELTGIGAEPWHFRYVGAPHALMMQEYDLALEEYVELLQDCRYGQRALHYRKFGLDICISFVPSEEEVTHWQSGLEGPCSISGNNVDGFVITQWR